MCWDPEVREPVRSTTLHKVRTLNQIILVDATLLWCVTNDEIIVLDTGTSCIDPCLLWFSVGSGLEIRNFQLHGHYQMWLKNDQTRACVSKFQMSGLFAKMSGHDRWPYVISTPELLTLWDQYPDEFGCISLKLALPPEYETNPLLSVIIDATNNNAPAAVLSF